MEEKEDETPEEPSVVPEHHPRRKPPLHLEPLAHEVVVLPVQPWQLHVGRLFQRPEQVREVEVEVDPVSLSAFGHPRSGLTRPRHGHPSCRRGFGTRVSGTVGDGWRPLGVLGS